MDKTQSVRLYRAGSPDEGISFWTPSEAHARKVHPNSAIHEAVLQPGFAQMSFKCCRIEALIEDAARGKDIDVLVFRSPDEQHEEYVVLNSHALTIIQ
jgi:hypothetical protein